MLFTSLDIFLFVPVVLAGFALLPAAARWAWLLAASLVFYGWSDPSRLVWLAGVAVAAWGFGAALARARSPRARRLWLAAGAGALVAALATFKFGEFGAPPGFSFYVFTAIAFLADTYRGQAPAGVHAGHMALHLAWFPKVLAGPIERAPGLLAQLGTLRPASWEQAVLGLQLVGWGLIKKVVIADSLAPIVDRAFGIAAYASPVELVISIYFFAFQIYCDFSGYTDIAIGLSLLFGLQLAENFRRPYLARSTAEFWADRWHISLGRWFRDYVYIPLGGSRVGAVRRYFNVMLVFAASGLWHAGLGWGVGWTFLVWGALNGFYAWGSLATRPLWTQLARRMPAVAASRAWLALRVLLTFHLIAFSWIFFRAKSLPEAWTILTRIGARAIELPQLALQYPYTVQHKTGLALIALLLLVELVDERRPILQRLAAAPAALRWAASYAGIAVLLVMGHWQARQFIYMQF